MENHIKAIDCLCTIHELIQKENTGTPDKLAMHLGISRRQLYRMLGQLKDSGASVKYDRIRRTFYYNSHFVITITKLHLSPNLMKNKKTK